MSTNKKLIFGWLLIVLLLVNYSIYQKESHLSHGTTVCLRLAPVDPRSLMQGDYMALRFALGDTIRQKITKQTDSTNKMRYSDGYAILKLEDNCTVSLVDLSDDPKTDKETISLHYRIRNHKIKIATNAFFFEEGTAGRYDKAKYGIFKLHNAQPILFDLADANLTPLSANTKN